jgi:hypothetical protein
VPKNLAAAGVLSLVASLAHGSEPPGPFKLDDTGMQRCSSAGGEWLQSCEGTGQDGAFGRDVTRPRRADGHAGFAWRKVSADGRNLPNDAADWRCVRDKVTGLLWDIQGDKGGLDDADRVFSNLGDGSPGDASTLVAAANAHRLCGVTQWRLPTLLELQSIVDYGAAAPGPAIDTAWFPRAVPKWYWTSEGYATDSNAAWAVYFNGPSTGDGAGLRTFKLAVRLVHGEPAVGGQRYVFNADEVLDQYTRLVWRRCAVGQTWSGSSCTGALQADDLFGALAHANDEAARTGQPWRLPNIKELSTLADRSRVRPAIDPQAFPDVATSQWYWSSTPLAADPTQAFTVDFTGGYTQAYPATGYPLGYRLVRNAD